MTIDNLEHHDYPDHLDHLDHSDHLANHDHPDPDQQVFNNVTSGQSNTLVMFIVDKVAYEYSKRRTCHKCSTYIYFLVGYHASLKQDDSYFWQILDTFNHLRRHCMARSHGHQRHRRECGCLLVPGLGLPRPLAPHEQCSLGKHPAASEKYHDSLKFNVLDRFLTCLMVYSLIRWWLCSLRVQWRETQSDLKSKSWGVRHLILGN